MLMYLVTDPQLGQLSWEMEEQTLSLCPEGRLFLYCVMLTMA